MTAPHLNPGEVVRLEDVLSPGIGGGVWTTRPYAVVLDPDRQEVGDRRYLTRQTFTDQQYAGLWVEWVQSGGASPKPDFPAGGV